MWSFSPFACDRVYEFFFLSKQIHNRTPGYELPRWTFQKEFPKPMNFADLVVNGWDSLLWKESHMKGVDLEYSTHQPQIHWVSIGLWIHHNKITARYWISKNFLYETSQRLYLCRANWQSSTLAVSYLEGAILNRSCNLKHWLNQPANTSCQPTSTGFLSCSFLFLCLSPN